MQTINLFGTDIGIKEYHCTQGTCHDLVKVRDKYVNLYIKVTEVCQARCKFCEFCTGGISDFDVYKMHYVLTEIQKVVKINKISFTGGEVTLGMTRFINIVEIARKACPDAFFVTNTNGYNIGLLDQVEEIDNISLSRHHYNDEINASIFDPKADGRIPTSEQIANLKNKHKMHLSCNLMKDYIGGVSEMMKYMDWAAHVGIPDVGFVTLMKVNDYCKEQHVDFRDLVIPEKDMILYKSWRNGQLCSCSNYLYNPSTADELVKVYARYNHDYLKGNESNLVFDGKNLRNGFYGDVIF